MPQQVQLIDRSLKFIYAADGSTRVAFVPAKNGAEVVQETTYYTFGAPIGALSWNKSVDNRNPFLREGKEYIGEYGWGKYDFMWRTFDSWIIQALQVDPMAEKYYGISPYAIWANNPMRFVDPDGRRVSIKLLSSVHQRSLQTFMGTTTGRAFVGRYMGAGDVLTVNGQKYTFDTKGDRAKDLLLIQSTSMDAQGRNQTLIKGTQRTTNNLATSDIEKTIENGVQQSVSLNKNLDEKTATGVLGHEAFVHADKAADALNTLDANRESLTLSEKRETLENISNSANQQHIDLGNNNVYKFKQYMNELTKTTGDKYYEQEYKRQVQDYKNRNYSNY